MYKILPSYVFNLCIFCTLNSIRTAGIIGEGYNVLTDKTVPSKALMLEFIEEDHMIIPKEATFVMVNETEQFMEHFEDEAEAVSHRLQKMNISLDVEYKLFSFGSRAGMNTGSLSAMQSSNKEVSMLYEARDFQLTLGNFQNLKCTPEFENDVRNLPASYEPNNRDCREKFEMFFNRWGHFFVTRAYGGGAMEMKISSNFLKTKNASIYDLKTALSASYSSFGGASFSYDNQREGQLQTNQILDQSSVKFWGGATELHNSETLKKEEIKRKWRLSCLAKPVMLDSELALEPISTIISKVDKNKRDCSYKALIDLLGGQFKVLKKKEEDDKKRAEIEKNIGILPTGVSHMRGPKGWGV